MRRTQSQWQALIEEQLKSGQSATTFCKARDINPKYFSLRKSRLQSTTSNQSKPVNFVRIPSPPPLNGFQLTYGTVSLIIPASYPAGALAELLRALR